MTTHSQNTVVLTELDGQRGAETTSAALRDKTPATRENVDLPVELRGGFGSRVFSGAV